MRKVLAEKLLKKTIGIFFLISCLTCIGLFFNVAKSDAAVKKSVTKNGYLNYCTGKGTLYIGKNIKKISPLSFDGYLHFVDIDYVKVSPKNKYFTAVNGVLYSKNKKKLIYYPQSKKGNSFTVKSHVKIIGANAFNSNKYLKKIILEKGVSEIRNIAFSGANLISIKISDSVKEIGDGVFERCEKLEEVKWNAKIDYIPERTFYNCRQLKGFVINKNIKKIREFAFFGAGITNIVLPENVREIGSDAFSCSGIREINFHKGIEKVGDYICSNCEYLKNVVYNAGVDYIPGSAFAYCSSLIRFDIPNDSVTSIECAAFAGCSNLEVKIGRSVEYIDMSAYKKGGASFEVACDNTAYCGEDGVLYSKDMKSLLFYPYKKRGDFILPETVCDINAWAFFGKYNITGITLNDNIQEFNIYGLNGCIRLKRLAFTDKIEKITCSPDEDDRWLGGYISGMFDFEEIYVPPNNKYYSVYEGCLYSYDFKVLYYIPEGREKLIIHKDVQQIIHKNISRNKFKSIEISDENMYFASVDGVFYDKNVSKILIFPGKLKLYNIPASVNDISEIQDVSDYDKAEAYWYSDKENHIAYSLEYIEADKDNPYYSSVDGVLYNKDITELCFYPPSRSGEYIVPDSVVSCYNPSVFSGATKLTSLTHNFSELYFDNCISLKKLIYKQDTAYISLGGIRGNENVDIDEIYLPGRLWKFNLYGDIGKETVFYGYNNEIEYECGNMLACDGRVYLKDYILSQGYKFENLGDAPEPVKKCDTETQGEKLIVRWKTLEEVDGYSVFYFSGQNVYSKEIEVKSVNGKDKKSCSFEKSIINGVKKIYIRSYKNINGIKVYSLPLEVFV